MTTTVRENVTEKDLPEIGKELSRLLPDHSCMVFTGDLGAGKTTLIKHLLKASGCLDEISSPTYAIANEYLLSNHAFKRAYHLDLYRINHANELSEFGFEEYLYDNEAVCLIEWPEIAKSLLPENVFKVHIETNTDGSRKILYRYAI